MARRRNEGSASDQPKIPVEEQIRTALGPDGLTVQLAAFTPLVPYLPDSGLGSDLKRAIIDGNAIFADAVRHHIMLPIRGWGIAGLPTVKLDQACDLIDAEQPDEADKLLAGVFDDGRMSWIIFGAASLGTADPDLREIGRHRRRLLELARDHHLAGRFDASIALLLAQIEGITADVTGGLFFSANVSRAAKVLDRSRLDGIEAGIETVRAVFQQGAHATTWGGGLSRHAVLHGRELAFDTEVNSAKCWSLLDVVQRWAKPVAASLADERRAARLAVHAGSTDFDVSGAREDRREFRETKALLGKLESAAFGWFGQLQNFRSDLVGGVFREADLQMPELSDTAKVIQWTRSDGQQCAFYRATISGWVLGISITSVGNQFNVENFSGAEPPPLPPTPGAGGWGTESKSPPDWNRSD